MAVVSGVQVPRSPAAVLSPGQRRKQGEGLKRVAGRGEPATGRAGLRDARAAPPTEHPSRGRVPKAGHSGRTFLGLGSLQNVPEEVQGPGLKGAGPRGCSLDPVDAASN